MSKVISYSVIQVTNTNPPEGDEWIGWKRLAYHYLKAEHAAEHLEWASKQLIREGSEDLRFSGKLELIHITVERKEWDEHEHRRNPPLREFAVNLSDGIPIGGREFKSV